MPRERRRGASCMLRERPLVRGSANRVGLRPACAPQRRRTCGCVLLHALFLPPCLVLLPARQQGKVALG